MLPLLRICAVGGTHLRKEELIWKNRNTVNHGSKAKTRFRPERKTRQNGQLSAPPTAGKQKAKTSTSAATEGQNRTSEAASKYTYTIHTHAAKVPMRPLQVLLGTGRSAQRPSCPDGTAAAAASHPQSAAVPRRAASMRDIAYAIVAAILSVFLVDCLFWHSAGLGTAVSAAAIYIATVLYLFGRKKHFDAYTAALGVLFLLLSASLVFSDNGGAKFFSLTAMTVLYAATVMDMASMRRSLPGTLGSVGDLFRTMFAQSFWARSAPVCGHCFT